MGLGDEVPRSRCAARPPRGTWNEAVRESDEAEADGSRADAPVGASRDIIARAKEAGSPSEAAQIRHGEKRGLFQTGCCHAVLSTLAGLPGSGVPVDSAGPEADSAMRLRWPRPLHGDSAPPISTSPNAPLTRSGAAKTSAC